MCYTLQALAVFSLHGLVEAHPNPRKRGIGNGDCLKLYPPASICPLKFSLSDARMGMYYHGALLHLMAPLEIGNLL